MYRKFAVRFAQNEQYQTSVSFRPHESVLKVDRKFSGSRRAIIHQRRSKVNAPGGRLKLRLILDRFSVEVFVNDGEQVMSATIYTDLTAEGISFFADGQVTMDVVKYDLGV
jgi:beta-fructofuranosidase